MPIWLPRDILSLPVPSSHATDELRQYRIKVESWRFTTRIELEADRHWQRAPLTDWAREELAHRLYEAWKVRHQGSHFATVVEVWRPADPRPWLLSEDSPLPYGGPYIEARGGRPGRVTMTRHQRLVLLQDGGVRAVTVKRRETLWSWLVTPLAKPLGEEAIRAEQSRTRMELGMTLEDVEALKDL
ncbi:hypothetical protein MFUR16E_21575 [Methylobacterium fujisawaense]